MIARAGRPRGEDRRPPADRIVAAHLDPFDGSIACGLEGGTLLRAPVDWLGLAGPEAVVWVEPDEVGHGLVLVREDGRLEDYSLPLFLSVVAARGRPDAEEPDRAELAERVGRRVRELRESRRLSQRDAAERLGMAASNLSRLESGRHLPTTDTLMRIAAELGVTLRALVSID